MGWLSYLPPVLQQPETYFTILTAFAAYGLAKGAKITDALTWIPEIAAMIVAIGVACGLHIGNSYVYAIGTGLICAWAASSFYTLAYTWLTSKIRGLVGVPASPSEPLQLPPQVNPPPKAP